MASDPAPRTGVVRAGDAVPLLTGPLGARLLAADTGEAGPAFVVHDLAAHALGSPLHTHSREDEWSFVLSGAVGVLIGEEVATAVAGDLVLKPRGVPHAFWNAGEEPASLLEVITPRGFEGYFAELADALGDALAAGGAPDPARLAGMAERYGVDLDPASVPQLARDHGLVLA